MKTLIFSAVASALLFPIAYSALGKGRVEYDSAQLVVKNSETIKQLVFKKIKKSQDIQAKQGEDDEGLSVDPEAVRELQDALRLVLARPDQDGTRANMFGRLRRELSDLNSVDQVLTDLSKESIAALKDTATPAKRQATYVVILENLMAEIKPDVGSNPEIKKIIESIRDAQLKLSDGVKEQQLLRAMNRPVSPSETAAKILPKSKK